MPRRNTHLAPPEGTETTQENAQQHALPSIIYGPPSALVEAGQAANRVAARHAFGEYQERLASSTLRRQQADLALFARYLEATRVVIAAEALFREPAAWTGVTWGLVQGFVAWLLSEGYAVGSINVRLATVRSYARLAAQAGVLPAEELGLIRSVRGYGRKQGRNLDAQRAVTRLGQKKAEAVQITDEVARTLKAQPDTPQGRRDTLLLCLLLDHGLRVGEAAELRVGDLDVAAGRIRFYRRKVDQTQVHKLTADTLRAATAYLTQDGGAGGPDRPLLQGSRKSGALSGQMSVRAIRERVRVLGEAVGVMGLSPHDCRHYWATYWAPRISTKQLQQAGGWASPAMPLHYAQASEVANEGMA